MKLNLASGHMYLEGYINIDNKSMYHGNMMVDKEADIFTLEWEDNTVDEIILSHFAMYIPYQEMEILLKRWLGWLKEGGKLIIETGNVKSIAQHILNNNDPSEINSSNGVMQLFGWETTAGHKWAWCP
jgi:predicted SAM-dependent methyltransferase